MPNHKPKLISVVIDIGTNLPPSWFHQEIDLFIVATEEAKRELVKFGALSNKIRVLGIPIDKKFLYEHQQIENFRDVAYCSKCIGKPHILLIGGREGCEKPFSYFQMPNGVRSFIMPFNYSLWTE